ncbi:MAG: FtsW/RodA/SpoVE family cell cycle protein [Clostridia bacterium]|jgi:cell division protein FtsW|nr:FtsW/RodA/SpoVE family cell cycle protein [Clostridia bacterium]
MFFLSTIDYKKYKMFDKIGYAVTILLLLAVLIPGVGLESGGATRWIVIGSFNFQPSEIAKIALVIFFASYLTDNREKLEERWEGFLRPLVLYLMPIIAILFLVQSHLSASVLIIAVISIMMIMAGCKLRYFFTYGSAGLAGAVGIMYFMATVLGKGGFRLGRIVSFLDPWADASGTGYQVVQGLYAIGSRADFLESGLGNSTQKYLYIPEPQNDFIFSIIAEELGFIRMYCSYSTFRNFCLERNCNCDEGTRYVWEFSCSRNYSYNWTSSYD